ncbi:penicillin-binding protein 2 [Leptolyngbya sp. FACHB-711]|uniref:peptidoglycan D,D-transpeptidase FtsI family protein n=1 Tax=unclassified Leptolyngbya TaxID=2650499 RepID=UPI00168256BA|nr:penicillin-binding protein 2 [Leptolyngbya sp. FACHB-711]MBD1848859.1 penicillin-binding protein 2 [Cyanobacteria bacterium FACHB-502]MBD2025324.1 penicillin-binding protein 2 [Leptolyngbya sp. FACHB-711]
MATPPFPFSAQSAAQFSRRASARSRRRASGTPIPQQRSSRRENRFSSVSVARSRSKNPIRRDRVQRDRKVSGSGSGSFGISPKVQRQRLLIVWLIMLGAMLLLLLNLLKIQVFQAGMLQERAKEQQVLDLRPVMPRRPIVDRSGNVLAIDQPVYTLFAHPFLFNEAKEKVAADLAPIVGQSVQQLMDKFKAQESGIRVRDDISEDTQERIATLGFDGLELVPEQERIYPQQALFPEIVGFVNADRQGQSGVEASLEPQIEQSIASMTLRRSGDGGIVPINLPEHFLQHQKDDLRLQLTVDSRLQRAARSALDGQMQKYNAKRGAVVVMDVQDGSIRSLVSAPAFDLNKFYEAKIEQLKNWILTDLYEPGSTFKPVNVAIALESGAVGSDASFYDEGAIEVDGWPIQNADFSYAGGRGQLSLTEILQHSSNVGMVHLMETLQPGVYYGWLEKLKINQPTEIDLPSEATGQLKDYTQFTESVIEPATTAFGQGFSLTPIKLLQLHAMLANGGKRVTPHVVRGLVDPHESLVWKPDLPTPEAVFSPKTANAVLNMMEHVVEEGTGKAAQIPGYRIAGKTGTAQKASPDGGYIDGARITSFVGIFPVEAPRYVVLAVVDEPQGDDAYGSTVTAPIVKSVMESIIAIDHLPPAKPTDQPQEEPAQP